MISVLFTVVSSCNPHDSALPQTKSFHNLNCKSFGALEALILCWIVEIF